MAEWGDGGVRESREHLIFLERGGQLDETYSVVFFVGGKWEVFDLCSRWRV